MLWSILLLAGASFEMDPAWRPVADPVAEHRSGRVQCFAPDDAARTCESLTWVEEGANGALTDHSVIAISNAPPMTLVHDVALEREGAAKCVRIDDSFFRGMQVNVGDKPVPAAAQAKAVAVVRGVLPAVILGKRLCVHQFAHIDGGRYLEVATADGELVGEMMAEFRWVDPDAGYRLRAPSPG